MDANSLVKVFAKCVAVGLGLGVVFGTLIGLIAPELLKFFVGEIGNPVGVGLGLGILNGSLFGFFSAVIIAFVARKDRS